MALAGSCYARSHAGTIHRMRNAVTASSRLLLAQLRRYRVFRPPDRPGQAFTAGYWGFAFGATALGALPLRLAAHGNAPLAAALAPVLFVAANLAVVVLGTLRLVVTGRLLTLPVLATQPDASPALVPRPGAIRTGPPLEPPRNRTHYSPEKFPVSTLVTITERDSRVRWTGHLPAISMAFSRAASPGSLSNMIRRSN
jgi:hypothetical protein